jgi:hypothetical protein
VISANFRLSIPGLVVTKLYRVCHTNNGVVTELLTAMLWKEIQTARCGSDYQVTLFMETRSEENIYDDDDQLEGNLDPHNLASTSKIFLTNIELRGSMDE